MSIAAGLIGSSLLGGAISSKSASKAAKAQQNAAEAANATELQQYQQSRQDLAPWREQGVKSLNQLALLMNPGGEMTRRFGMTDFQTDPGYNFRMTQGENALSRAMGAQGMRNSGAALKEAMKYNQGLASDEYQNAYNRWAAQNTDIYNRLAGLANTGQTTSNQLANFGSNYSSQYGQNLGQAANARASQYAAQGQAAGNVLSDLTGLGMMYGAQSGKLKQFGIFPR